MARNGNFIVIIESNRILSTVALPILKAHMLEQIIFTYLHLSVTHHAKWYSDKSHTGLIINKQMLAGTTALHKKTRLTEPIPNYTPTNPNLTRTPPPNFIHWIRHCLTRPHDATIKTTRSFRRPH